MSATAADEIGTYAHVHSSWFMRDDVDSDAKDVGGGARLPRLIAEASAARRSRTNDARGSVARCVESSQALEDLLLADAPAMVDVPVYLTRVVSLVQLLTPCFGRILTSIASRSAPSAWSKGLAAAIVEVLHFVAAGLPVGDRTAVKLAVAFEDRAVVVGISFEGPFSPLAPARATEALARAAAIVAALDGDFSRGVEPDRMVFGATLPMPRDSADTPSGGA